MASDTLVRNLRTELEMSERKRLRLQRSRFLKDFEPEDTSLWTMLDLMSLILIFFIMLYTVPAPPAASDIIPKIQQPLSKIFKKPVSRDTARPGNDDNSRNEDNFGNNEKLTTDEKFTTDGRFQNHTRVEKTSASRGREGPPDTMGFLALEKDLHLAMAGTALSDYDIRMTRDRIKLVIGENISFPVGKAELLDHIKGPLAKIGDALSREQGFRIVVAGHTDTTPINTPRFPSNWELSLARALGVAKFLMARDVNPARISVEGFGPYQPVASNTDPESRRANRRVEISLIQDDPI